MPSSSWARESRRRAPTSPPKSWRRPAERIDAVAVTPKYKRILLKLSGEALMGEDPFGINRPTIEAIVAEIAQVSRLGVEICVGIRGGHIMRGVAPATGGIDGRTAHYIGMPATALNAVGL